MHSKAKSKSSNSQKLPSKKLIKLSKDRTTKEIGMHKLSRKIKINLSLGRKEESKGTMKVDSMPKEKEDQSSKKMSLVQFTSNSKKVKRKSILSDQKRFKDKRY